MIELPYPRENAVDDLGEAPALLVANDGSAVRDEASWRARREELKAAILDAEYGGMPPQLPPEATVPELLSEGDAWRRAGVAESKVLQYRVSIGGGVAPLGLSLTLYLPKREGRFPVIINGDGCWAYMNDAVIAEIVGRGFALAYFNRCEIARDWDGARDCGIYAAFPGEYGALSAWAWTYHRVYDALLRVPEIDSAKVAITGHSRGGKTVLLAAATDERIAAVCDNNSGCCGFSSFRVRGEWGERIEDITRNFPFWFAKDFGKWAGREAELPFDQHFLAALVAPRPLCFAVANDDNWSNQTGACQTYRDTMPVYELLGKPENFRIVFRDGPHGHELGDFARFSEWLGALWK